MCAPGLINLNPTLVNHQITLLLYYYMLSSEHQVAVRVCVTQCGAASVVDVSESEAGPLEDSGALQVAVSPQGTVCGVTKIGRGGLDPAVMLVRLGTVFPMGTVFPLGEAASVLVCVCEQGLNMCNMLCPSSVYTGHGGARDEHCFSICACTGRTT